MSKLRKLESPLIERFNGYLAAAQHAFIKGQYDVDLRSGVLRDRRTAAY